MGTGAAETVVTLRVGGSPSRLGQSQYLAQRTSGSHRGPSCIVVFGLGPTGGHLDGNQVPVDLHLIHGAGRRPPPDGVGPNA